MREWQSLPQRSHLCVVSGLSEVLRSFRSALSTATMKSVMNGFAADSDDDDD